MGKIKSPRAHPASAMTSRGLGGPKIGGNVKVIVRVRPFSEREQGDNSRQIVDLVDDQILIFDPKTNQEGFFYHGVEQKRRDLLQKSNKNLEFMFDKVFAPETDNGEVFEHSTKGLIDTLMEGYNCSVFAYGATGSGKTFTMLGQTENPGITYLTIEELFKAKANLAEERDFQLTMTYIEVYNETVQDLLNPGPKLTLRDDGRYGVLVGGVKVHKITSPDELFDLLAFGNSNRSQHPTDANAESSRSHAVFQVSIQMKFKITREIRQAKLSMIDLAGSERGSATGFGGVRFVEGANINKSLLALGNCINSLASGQKYIPYRNSKLTRLLKDSLGGNCHTVMIANVSPSSLTFEDTHNTLKYAQRAMRIKTDLTKNVVSVNRCPTEYMKIIQDLKRENDRLKELAQAKPTKICLEPALQAQFDKLLDEHKTCVDRLHNLEYAESIVKLRKKIKEETDARLSFLMTDEGTKNEAHVKLGNTVDRFNKQENTLDTEISKVKHTMSNISQEIEDFVRVHSAEQVYKPFQEQMKTQDLTFQNKILQRRYNVLEEEYKSQMEVLGRIAKGYKSYHMQLIGHGLQSELAISNYKEIERHYQGMRNITFEDVNVEPPLNVAPLVRNVTPVKRPNDENTNVLNGTFVAAPKYRICAEAITKVYKSSPAIKKRKEAVSNLINDQRQKPRTRKALSKPIEPKKLPPFRT